MNNAFDVVAGGMLPRNATAFMRSHLAAQLEAFDLDVAAIPRESDWETATVDNLPLLAFDKGVRIWSDKWTDAQKRYVVRHAFVLAQLQGTPLGIELFLNLANGVVLREHLPPARAFAFDEDPYDREELAAQMPQLRLYYSWPPVEMPDLAFADRDFAGEIFADANAATILGRYPVLWDGGVETPLGLAELRIEDGRATLAFRGERGSAFFADAHFADDGFLGEIASDAPIVFNINDPALVYFGNAQPAPYELGFGEYRFAGVSFADRDAGNEHAYDRLVLWDASRLSTSTSPASSAAFADEAWLGIARYNILLEAALPGYPAAIPQHWQYADAGFAINFETEDLAFAMEAINASKRVGDRVLVELKDGFGGGKPADIPAV